MTSPIAFSRSEVECLRRCPKEAFYRYYRPNPTPTPGWTPKEPSLPLTLGLCGHKGQEVLFKLGSNIDAACEAATEEWDRLTEGGVPKEGRFNPEFFSAEQKALLMAFLRVWRVQFWDAFNQQYEVLSIEKEIRREVAPSATLQARCDLVIRERDSGLIWVPDWKFVKDGRGWGEKWPRESQTYSQIHAVEGALGEEVAGAIYWGFLKGDRKDNRQASPLVWAYRRELRPGVWEYSEEYQRTKGWERFPIWECEDFGPTPFERVKYWVNWLPEEVRAQQCIVSPPVLKDAHLIDEWVRSSVRLVKRAHRALGEGDVEWFSPSRSEWNCGKCPYRRPCFGEEEWEESERGMMPRVDHHVVGEE